MLETAYLLQSVLIVLWWLGISLSDSFYGAFEFPGIEQDVFSAFLLPDIIAIAALSVFRGYKKSRELQLIIFGAFLYATLYCVNASVNTGGGTLSTSMMVIGLGYNGFLCYGRKWFRAAAPVGVIANGLKTLVQIVCIWFLALALIPFLILKAFAMPLIPTCGVLLWIGGCLFVCFSFLGLFSSYVLVKLGKGTPLPLDQTNELVVAGPYAWVRNPMAVAGIGQGIAVGLAYGSLPILCYAALGAVVWHFVVKPFEERDMLKRFGDSYEAYRSQVKCWMPRFKKPNQM
jgi:protein-S-isoprenylcysteine O-methyltransferase Ste14